jgi:ATP-dependent DNA helicase RecG
MIDINLPVNHLPSIGTKYSNSLANLKIYRIKDLLHHYPVRYDDLSQHQNISNLVVGEKVTLTGTIHSFYSRKISGGRSMQSAIVSDDTGNLNLTWFNQPYLERVIKSSDTFQISGTVNLYRNHLTITSPVIEKKDIFNEHSISLHTGRLVSQYAQTAGISSKWLRRQISNLINGDDFEVDEILPDRILNTNSLISRTKALRQIHFPENYEQVKSAHARLAFDELFLYQLVSQQLKTEWHRETMSKAYQTPTDLDDFVSSLPFKLTSAQQRSLTEIARDLNSTTTMHRLLQGDVGSGKTIIAALSSYIVASQKDTTLIMAPTEVLAEQHYHTFLKLFQHTPFTIGLATGTVKKDLDSASIIIGTHALLYQSNFNHVGLVVIDEQHRFGVEQRAQLLKQKPTPHLLSMTATPIPRTIALTLYSQLDMSFLDELPVGRLPVITKVVSESKRTQAYSWISALITKKQAQVFYVCPLIESSITPKLDQVKAVQVEYEHLKSEVFPQHQIGLLHGRMNAKEKKQVLDQFHQHQLDILVTTPVIEVGVDVKNATVMVIESAERFGLASLHQLRGRVGRSDKKSYCLLFTSHDKTAKTRLEHLEKNHLGSSLAQIDLDTRGPGHLFGTKQSGYIELKLASLTDSSLIALTHKEVTSLLSADPSLVHHPALSQEVRELLDKLKEAD